MPAESLCRDCLFFMGDPQALERAFPGLNTLSSAFGSVRADTGLCRRHDTLVVARSSCAAWERRADSAND